MIIHSRQREGQNPAYRPSGSIFYEMLLRDAGATLHLPLLFYICSILNMSALHCLKAKCRELNGV